VSEGGQNDDQQRLSKLQRKRAHCRRHPNLARARIAVKAFRILVPCQLPILEGQAANVPAMKLNELAERAHARIVPKRGHARIVPRPLGRVVSNARAHGFERSLPEQAIDKRRCGRVIRDEPVFARERNPESAEVREVCQAVA
jgi:hypothetical protein